MKLDKAIEIKELHHKGHWPEDNPDVIEADRLSIEALKRLQNIRGVANEGGYTPLPGETTE